MAVDIVALGEPLYEFNQESDGRFRAGFGGDTSNAVIAAARLGAKTAYVTRLGTDLFGDALMGLWQREAVDAQDVTRDPEAPTGVYVVTHTDEGHRFTYLRKGSAASRMTPDDVPAKLFNGTRFLHVSAVSQAISASATETVRHAMALARGAGAQVSYDTNLRLKLWSLDTARATIMATMPQANIVKTAGDDAELLFGATDADSIADHLLDLGTEIVIVTKGREGALIATPERRVHLSGHVLQAVDATGAGDAFSGAFLAELCAGRDVFEAARFANAAAALSTTGTGAVDPLPRRNAVEEYLKSA